MIRQTIVLNKYTYILDLYKAISDLKDNQHYEEFVLIRKTNIMNSIMYDKDVYFINKSLIDACTIDGKLEPDLLSEIIAYPVTSDGVTLSYSTKYKGFNKDLSENSFKLGFDISNIYGKDCENDAKILCDKLRVWLPITNSKLNGIIHVTNLINDIRFHYICQRTSTFQTNSNGEMYYGNDIYSEYFDIWIPNIEYLFNQSNCYIKENFNISEINQKIIFKYNQNDSITITPRVYFDFEENDFVKKAKIDAVRTSLDSEYSLYVNDQKLEWNFAQTQEFVQTIQDDDIQIFLKDEFDSVVAKYDLHHNEIIKNGNDIFVSLFLMILPFYIADYSFDDSVIGASNTLRKCKLFCDINAAIVDDSLITPLVASIYQYDYIDDTSNTYCQDKLVLKNSDIFTLSKDIKLKASFKFCENKDLPSCGALMLNCEFNCNGVTTEEKMNEIYLNKSKCTIYDYMYFEDADDFDTDVFPEEITKCGFVVEMAPTNEFKDILYKFVKNVNVSSEDDLVITNCEFGLNFDCGQEQWNSYPETLVLRVRYVDKVSFNVINSNPIFVTKEIFKYLISGNDNKIEYRLKMYDNNQIYDDESMELKNKFNFIDKINCVVVKNETDEQNKLTNSKTTSKIVYKPIFFKVKDLQQIKIKSGIAQNIGLNLSDFISKVDTFKITIAGKEYVEVARNDGYVIFNINALELSENAGQYNLLNQDDEYISDGTWYTY